MSKFYKQLDEKLKKFIHEQHIFFTATGTDAGRINLSPKGMDTFRILSDTQVGFLSVTGSGNETAAHLKSDGRITIMMCSFTKSPLIFRIYGHGTCIYPQDQEWGQYSTKFELLSGTRQIFIIDIQSIQTSCGYSIPFYDYVGERDALLKWSEQKGTEGVKEYWRKKNQSSIDGLDTGLHV